MDHVLFRVTPFVAALELNKYFSMAVVFLADVLVS